MPGAIMGEPTHDEVMRRRPDTQGRSGHKGPSRLAPASTPPCILPLLCCPSVPPAAGSCVACRELSCSSFTEGGPT